MINIQKGITLFLTKEESQKSEVSGLVKFLSDEYNFISINVSTTIPAGTNKFGISTQPEYISKAIKANSFRLDGVCLNIPPKLKYYKMIWNQLKEYENLIIFVICPSESRLDAIPHDTVVFRDIFEIINNPDWNLTTFGSFLANKDEDLDTPRFLFRNILTEEDFSLDNFKQTYIRDKKLDIFLDDSEDI
jgi:hypothetical protein